MWESNSPGSVQDRGFSRHLALCQLSNSVTHTHTLHLVHHYGGISFAFLLLGRGEGFFHYPTCCPAWGKGAPSKPSSLVERSAQCTWFCSRGGDRLCSLPRTKSPPWLRGGTPLTLHSTRGEKSPECMATCEQDSPLLLPPQPLNYLLCQASGPVWVGGRIGGHRDIRTVIRWVGSKVQLAQYQQ